ncbi:hypothetical protein DPEC_G00161090 [Dallia pectoralis]|uniref:Uncharacterized protein n=1 Tax=Dallia pectoralis TaxID=75939 RepID=A0ACC2GG81_DALPE|nr:hypothetical protein DPEC_G00161090 [Dallia pectoralis]
MGGNNSSHNAFEDEGDQVTFVKGIRLTDKVIHRMREERQAAQKSVHPHPTTPAAQLLTEQLATTTTSAHTVEHLAPRLLDPPPSTQPAYPLLPVQPVKLTPPPPVTFVAAPPAPPKVPAPAVESAGPPLPKEPVVLATPLLSPIKPEVVATPSTRPVEAEVLPQVAEPVVLSPAVESDVIPASPPSAEAVVSSPPFVDASVLSFMDDPVVLPMPGRIEREVVPTPVESAVPTAVVKEAPVVEPAILPAPPAVVAPPPGDVVLLKPPPVEPLTIHSPPVAPPRSTPRVLDHTPEPIVAELQAPTRQLMELATTSSTQTACEQADLLPRVEPSYPPPPMASEESTASEEPTSSEEPRVSVPLPQLVDDDDDAIPTVASVTALTPALPAQPSPVVDEEELRRQIQAELTKDLEEEMKRKRQELLKQLDEVKVAARVQAQAVAQLRVQEEVQKIRSLEKAAQSDRLKEAFATERMISKDEKLMAQLYWIELKAQKLEEKEKQLNKQDLMHKEHVARLEEKNAQFFKVTTENFNKGREEVHHTFRRVNIKPVCSDLQTQVLQCYRVNSGQTLVCSGLANLYMQCVDSHKKTKSTGLPESVPVASTRHRTPPIGAVDPAVCWFLCGGLKEHQTPARCRLLSFKKHHT